LTLIARLSGDKIEAILDRSTRERAPDASAPAAAVPDASARYMVVAYGGAMHNDGAPRPGHEAWSYGPRIAKRAQALGYVELDLVVPEFVKGTDAWKAQPWYPHFKRGAQGQKTLLFTVAPGSYALVFPETTDAVGRVTVGP
jgi:hypothetical protein